MATPLHSTSEILNAPSFEHHASGLGLAFPRPRISWSFAYSSELTLSQPSEQISQGWRQTGYDIEVTDPSGISTDRDGLVRIHHVDSSASVLVPWPEREQSLKSRDVRSVRVRSHFTTKTGSNQESQITDWSPPSRLEIAFLERDDWLARLIVSTVGRSYQDDGAPLRPVRFRKTFEVSSGPAEIVRARLYITSLGIHHAWIDGKRVGGEKENFLAPGWTSYCHRLEYRVHDVGDLLRKSGDKGHVIAVEVAEGWYAGRLIWGQGKRYVYGTELGVLAQLEVTVKTSEGEETVTVKTDDSWTCNKSAIVSGEIYDGEVYDMREEQGQEAWDSSVSLPSGTAFTDRVKTLPLPTAQLIAPSSPAVNVTQEVSPVSIFTTPSGKTVVDFGQNLVGVVRLNNSLSLPQDHEISFIYTEVLENGEVATRPLRNAKCTDKIIFGGNKSQANWTPKFTFHGFRYMQVNGWPGMPTVEGLTALVMHTDMRRRGWFSCSDPLVNKLHENIVWGMRGNFVSIPTDCPQRDERLGWTGDIQVFGPSANFLYDTIGMLSGWLEDVSAEQLAKAGDAYGIPGLVVPDVLPDEWVPTPQAVWHDVVILTPWDLYCSSGDPSILERQFPSMRAWIDTAIRRGPDGLWNEDVWQLGDWLDPAAPPDEPGNGRTDGVLVADAYLCRITTVFSQVCEALGQEAEKTKYTADYERLRKAFQHKYMTPAGNLMNNTQTAISLALRFDLYPTTTQRENGAHALSRLVRGSGFRISTGFAGTPVISHALTDAGHPQLAYRMLMEKHNPSWLYSVTMGATTVWERWDSLLPDGAVNPGSMTSFNHYALGAVAAWLHASVGGLASPDGWQTIHVTPVPGGTLTHAHAAFDGPYGRVACEWTWTRTDHLFRISLCVPPNSTARIRLPGSAPDAVVTQGSGLFHYQCTYDPGEWPPRGPPQAFWGTPMCDCA